MNCMLASVTVCGVNAVKNAATKSGKQVLKNIMRCKDSRTAKVTNKVVMI